MRIMRAAFCLPVHKALPDVRAAPGSVFTGVRGVYIFIAPGPAVAPGGTLPRIIMPNTSSLVTSCVLA